MAKPSRLQEIREFQDEGYTDFPDLGEEHVRLLLAVVDAVIGPHPDGLEMQIEHYRELTEMALDAGSSGASASHGYRCLADALEALT